MIPTTTKKTQTKQNFDLNMTSNRLIGSVHFVYLTCVYLIESNWQIRIFIIGKKLT